MSFKSLKANCYNNYFSNIDDFSLGHIDMNLSSKSLCVLQFNIWGMNDLRKFDKLLNFIDGLHLYTDIHLIVLTETFIKSSNIFSFNIKNFSNIFSCRDDRSGGGIAMYIRHDIRYNILNIDDGTLPFQFICVQLLGFNPTKVCGVYRPPGSDTTYFLEILEQVLFSNKTSSDFIIVGDLNIPVNKDLKLIHEYNSTLLSHGMIVTNTFATRPVSGNILDHAISSFLNIERVFNSTIESDISDHSFIFSKFIFKPKYITKRLEKKTVNHDKVNQHFDEFLLSTSFDIHNPDSTLKLVFGKYNELVDKYSKSKQLQVKMKNASNCPWMNLDLWYLIKQKNRALKRFKKNINNRTLKDRLDSLNKKIKSKKYFAKKYYFNNLFKNLNQKEVWNQINQFMKHNTKETFHSIVNNDVEYKDLSSIVNLFNNYFVNVGNSFTSTSNSTIELNNRNNSNSNSFFLSPISVSEIYNIINSLDNNKGGGYDNIPNIAIKHNSTFFSHLLTDLFNVVFETGTYPDCLKIAKVSPIFKSGDRKVLSNYRPISVLSVFDKILEKLIANRITEYLNKLNFFYSHQYGFRQGSGTDTALIEITDFIYRAFDNQEYICGLFLDLHKAFDNIDHRLLLNKLYCYGFRGLAHNLLTSYLQNRKQFVALNGVISSTLTINCGVPQGSVLGPILFLIFINDISHLPLSGQIRMFADDTAIFYNSKDCSHAMINMETDINVLLEYFNLNKISLNVTKTKFIIFHSPFLPYCHFPPFQDSNGIIERVDKLKYLGVILDKHMSWNDHIHALSLKVSPFIYLIRKLASFVPKHILKMIYFSFIHTRFYFAIATFGNAGKSKLKKLQILQNKSCKAIYRLPQLFPSVELYKNVAEGILPIYALFQFHVSLYMYKCLNMSSTLSNIEFQYVNHSHSTRSSNILVCYKIKTEFGRRSMSFVGPHVYNDLPNNIRKSVNVYKFKKILKTHLAILVDDYL